MHKHIYERISKHAYMYYILIGYELIPLVELTVKNQRSGLN